jgi:hypothetical protein
MNIQFLCEQAGKAVIRYQRDTLELVQSGHYQGKGGQNLARFLLKQRLECFLSCAGRFFFESY